MPQLRIGGARRSQRTGIHYQGNPRQLKRARTRCRSKKQLYVGIASTGKIKEKLQSGAEACRIFQTDDPGCADLQKGLSEKIVRKRIYWAFKRNNP